MRRAVLLKSGRYLINGGPCAGAGVPRAENVAAAGVSYASALVGGAAGGIAGTVTWSTGGGGRGARAGPGRPGSMVGGGGRG